MRTRLFVPNPGGCEKVVKVGARYHEFPSLYPADAWFRKYEMGPSGEEYAGWCFEPGKPAIVGDRVNRWHDSVVTPEPGEGHLEWLAWMQSVCSEAELGVIFEWMRRAVLQPGDANPAVLQCMDCEVSTAIAARGISSMQRHYYCCPPWPVGPGFGITTAHLMPHIASRSPKKLIALAQDPCVNVVTWARHKLPCEHIKIEAQGTREQGFCPDVDGPNLLHFLIEREGEQ
jgi:hypothetical protein